MYVDASGEDDWDVNRDRYYLHGFMCCGASPEWLHWIETHRTKYNGAIHWAPGTFGKEKQKLPNKKDACRQLLAMHPWLQTGIHVFDKLQFQQFILGKYGRGVKKYDVVRRIWQTSAIEYLKLMMPHLKKLVPNDPFGCLNLRHVIINNPKGGNRLAIESRIKTEFGRIPRFMSAGHYGIDALDGVLWAFHRLFNLGKSDCLPQSALDFSRDLQVVVLGVRSNRPILLRNATDVAEFRATQHLINTPRQESDG